MKENYEDKKYDPEVERLAEGLSQAVKKLLIPMAILIAIAVVILLAR